MVIKGPNGGIEPDMEIEQENNQTSVKGAQLENKAQFGNQVQFIN
jgi:hypothetical protein